LTIMAGSSDIPWPADDKDVGGTDCLHSNDAGGRAVFTENDSLASINGQTLDTCTALS